MAIQFVSGPGLIPPRYDEKKNIIYAGSKSAKDLSLFIRPSKHGVAITVKGKNIKAIDGIKTKGAFPLHYTIPGEVSRERAADILIQLTGYDVYQDTEAPDKIVDSQAMRKHNLVEVLGKIWPQRGFSDPNNQLPPGYWDWIDDRALLQGTKHTPKMHWRDLLTKSMFEYADPLTSEQNAKVKEFQKTLKPDRTSNGKLVMLKERQMAWYTTRSKIDELQEHGLLPEWPHGRRKWNTIPYDRYLKLLTIGIGNSPVYGTYVGQVDPTFGKIIEKHPEEFVGWNSLHPKVSEARDDVLTLLASWQKSPRMANGLDRAINAGVPIQMLVERDIKNGDQLEHLCEIAEIASMANSGRAIINPNYEKPPIDPPQGLEFADHHTFRGISNTYGNCISNNGRYEDAIVNGTAHVLFAPNPKRVNGDGCCAFIEWKPGMGPERKGSWTCHEILGFGNHPCDEEWKDKVKLKLREMNTLCPGPHKRVEQKLTRDVLGDDIRTFQIDKQRLQRDYPHPEFTIKHLLETVKPQHQDNRTFEAEPDPGNPFDIQPAQGQREDPNWERPF